MRLHDPAVRAGRMALARLLPALLCALWASAAGAGTAPHFAVVGDHFELDGKPYLIRSGEMHYPRIAREQWRRRLRMARSMGLNTIQTYVFWNLHEPAPGRFDFSGNLDLVAFVRAAQAEGLNVIVRPGPYICAEWDFGGLPAWLLRTPGLRPRSSDPRFLAATAHYFKRLGGKLQPLMSTRGGPILMAQLENEYGSFGSDRDYLAALRQQMLDAGFDLPLFTADGPTHRMLQGGTLPGVTAAINVDGSPQDIAAAFRTLEAQRPGGPQLAAEYYPGWFDHWGEHHHTRNAADSTAAVEWFLAHGVSFNLYMAAGGTSFGYMAGANYSAKVPYQPDTTSYDYDAPIDEAGRPTRKFFRLRGILARHLAPAESLPDVPAMPAAIAVANFELKRSAALFDNLAALGTASSSRLPQTMEELGQNSGFVLYRKHLDQAVDATLRIDEPRDYAQVFVDGAPLGTLDRGKGENQLRLRTFGPAMLDILVENMGRINFDQKLLDEHKGISRTVTLGDEELTGWENVSLPLTPADLARLHFRKVRARQAPAFHHGEFTLRAVGDTFLDLRGWGKGHVWVNGHHVGRFWQIGPQQTLYVPGAWLRKGSNTVVVLDVEPRTGTALSGTTSAVYE